ncbi:MAG: hypothetical protein U0936_10405 [Planctomycetaceae bacterium]
MAIEFNRSVGRQGIYADAFRVLMPGIVIAVMLMAIAFQSRSAADSELLSFEKSFTSRNATPEDLREEISLHAGSTEASPIKANLLSATESGLRRLSDPEEVAALERVTIEINLPQLKNADPSGGELPLELLEVLSRRASPLHLELTLRVAPANAAIAMEWFDAVRRNAAAEQIVGISAIAISLDKGMSTSKLQLDVLRIKNMVTTKEWQQ